MSPKYTQSAVINTSDNTFYWFANEEDEAANLYTVDLTTGEAALVGALPYGDQVVGLIFPTPKLLMELLRDQRICRSLSRTVPFPVLYLSIYRPRHTMEMF